MNSVSTSDLVMPSPTDHPVLGKLSWPWSYGMWEGEVTVCFSIPSAGWINLALISTASNSHHVVHLSEVFCPFEDMVRWLNDIVEEKFPAVVEIDEEGIFTKLFISRYDADWLEFRVTRPADGVQVEQGKWLSGPESSEERFILCRVRKFQFLQEWNRRLLDFLENDFDIAQWGGSNWYHYLHDGDPYPRYQDLRRLNLSTVRGWLMKMHPRTVRIEKIVSGGQTGVDRAALDWALAHQYPHGGWCPVGRKAEDGSIPVHYLLAELPGGGYRQRTKANVRDSDATLILSLASELTGGSLATAQFAQRLQRPWLHLSAMNHDWKSRLKQWLGSVDMKTLNVAGPRLSKEPGIAEYTFLVLDEVDRLLHC